jgi:hypothetical protein
MRHHRLRDVLGFYHHFEQMGFRLWFGADLWPIWRMRSPKILVRSAIVLLAALAVVLAIISFLPTAYLARLISAGDPMPLAPTPLPPTILAPRREMPNGPVGLEEWAQYQGEAYRLAGSGFLLRLEDGRVVGVTTAHSLTLGQAERGLERVAFAVAGRDGFVAEFDAFQGLPGRARTGGDMTVDYVLMPAPATVEAGLALSPDPRGGPQPGERVSLFSGLGNDSAGRRVLDGVVQSAQSTAIWVLMDETFDAGLTSGSPLLSRHTGQVAGMAIAVAPRDGRVLIGFHPIGSIVRLAEAATESPKLAEYNP